jgi:hypothetical protein
MARSNMVSQKLLNELKQIIKEDYGVELTQKETSEVGNTLVQFFELLIKIQNDGTHIESTARKYKQPTYS